MASISSSSFPPEGGPIRSFLLGEPLDDRWIQIGDGLLVSAVLIRIDQEVAEDIETHETTIFYAHESIKPTKKLFVVLHWSMVQTVQTNQAPVHVLVEHGHR
jgi:hypothetical protein